MDPAIYSLLLVFESAIHLPACRRGLETCWCRVRERGRGVAVMLRGVPGDGDARVAPRADRKEVSGVSSFIAWLGEESRFGGGQAVQEVRVAAQALAEYDVYQSTVLPQVDKSEISDNLRSIEITPFSFLLRFHRNQNYAPTMGRS